MGVVRNLDLKRYMGRWYEIASFPSSFEPRNGENTRATYTLHEEGPRNFLGYTLKERVTVFVLNETWSNGKRCCIEGTVNNADPNSDEAKLKVKFYVPPFLPIIPVIRDYWVLDIDDDYQYAVIGTSSKNNLQILSRTSHIDEDKYEELVQKARDAGYDVSKLHKIPHAETPPE